MTKDSQPVQMSLFPTMGSSKEVFDYAKSQLPITSTNELYSLLMLFQNTLLKEVDDHYNRNNRTKGAQSY